jgi:aryl-alcohol dehydrogenase-like predicted oxidoreductase
MNYRQLGNTGLTVSEVGFGAWTLTSGWWGEHGEDSAVRLLRLAFDLGVTFFDTADVYGDGRGETVLAAALGPVRERCVIATKFGYNWYDRDEGLYAIRERRLPALQIIHNMLEQEPGRDLLAAGKETCCGFVARVPHSSGLLEGHYSEETTFPPGDHRNHRPRSWLIEGLKKVERLRFLQVEGRRTLGQAAIQWLLSQPGMASVLPNIYDEAQLREFAAAGESPALGESELQEIERLYAANFELVREAAT